MYDLKCFPDSMRDRAHFFLEEESVGGDGTIFAFCNTPQSDEMLQVYNCTTKSIVVVMPTITGPDAEIPKNIKDCLILRGVNVFDGLFGLKDYFETLIKPYNRMLAEKYPDRMNDAYSCKAFTLYKKSINAATNDMAAYYMLKENLVPAHEEVSQRFAVTAPVEQVTAPVADEQIILPKPLDILFRYSSESMRTTFVDEIKLIADLAHSKEEADIQFFAMDDNVTPVMLDQLKGKIREQDIVYVSPTVTDEFTIALCNSMFHTVLRDANVVVNVIMQQCSANWTGIYNTWKATAGGKLSGDPYEMASRYDQHKYSCPDEVRCRTLYLMVKNGVI